MHSKHVDEMSKYVTRARRRMGNAKTVLYNLSSIREWTQVAPLNTATNVHVAGVPGLPRLSTGASAVSEAISLAGGTILGGRYQQYFAVGKRGCFAFKATMTGHTSLTRGVAIAYKADASGNNAFIGAMLDATNYRLWNGATTQSITGPAITAVDRIFEVRLDANSAVEDFIVDGVSYGGNPLIVFGDSTLMFETFNAAAAVNCTIHPKWAFVLSEI